MVYAAVMMAVACIPGGHAGYVLSQILRMAVRKRGKGLDATGGAGLDDSWRVAHEHARVDARVVVGVLGIGGGGVGGGWGWQVLTGWACLRVCNGEQRRDEDVQ